MRSLLRFGALGCALALTALPLAIGGGGAVAGAALTSPATVSASNWTTMPNTNTTVNPTNGMSGVSCVTSVWCVAVGNGANVDTDAANIELWNGTTWSPMTSPTVPGESDIYLAGVSCVTTSFCVAVGSVDTTSFAPLIEQWNGTTWSVVQSSPPSSTSTVLTGVSCTEQLVLHGRRLYRGGRRLGPGRAVERLDLDGHDPHGAAQQQHSGVRACPARRPRSACSPATPFFPARPTPCPSPTSGTGRPGPGRTLLPTCAQTTDYHLFGVSCAGTKFCTAVGESETGAQPPVTVRPDLERGRKRLSDGLDGGDRAPDRVRRGQSRQHQLLQCHLLHGCRAETQNSLAVTWDGAVLDAAVHPDRPVELRPERSLRRGLPDRLGLCGGG